MKSFLRQLSKLPDGYSEGHFEHARYGVTISRSADGRRNSLYAEQLGGNDMISFNLYFGAGGEPILKPCEMPAAKVISFVAGFEPEQPITHNSKP